MNNPNPNLAIKNMAELRQRKAQLQHQIDAAKQAAMQSANPLKSNFSDLLKEKVAPLATVAVGLALAYRFLKNKKTEPQNSHQQSSSSWKELLSIALPLLKIAVPSIQEWYKNRQ